MFYAQPGVTNMKRNIQTRWSENWSKKEKQGEGVAVLCDFPRLPWFNTELKNGMKFNFYNIFVVERVSS